jgi:RNase P/RNase MRP subunit p29
MSRSDEKRFLRGEFIGRTVTVMDRQMHEVHRGTVMWETKNMLLVGDKNYPKKSHYFIFETDGGSVRVDGSKIAYKPEDRIKRLR